MLRLAPKVIDRTFWVCQDFARGNENVVDPNPLSTVWHMERVVGDCVGVVVREPIEVPIRVTAQHDGRLLRRRERYHFDVPVPTRKRVGDVRDHLTREALFSIWIRNGKGDAAVGVGHDGEVSVIPAVRSAMQSINTFGGLFCRVFVWRDTVHLVVDDKRAVLDAVGIPAWNTAKMRVLRVLFVVARIVEAGDDVALDAILVLDEEV